jgi:hypothetical protein
MTEAAEQRKRKREEETLRSGVSAGSGDVGRPAPSREAVDTYRGQQFAGISGYLQQEKNGHAISPPGRFNGVAVCYSPLTSFGFRVGRSGVRDWAEV